MAQAGSAPDSREMDGFCDRPAAHHERVGLRPGEEAQIGHTCCLGSRRGSGFLQAGCLPGVDKGSIEKSTEYPGGRSRHALSRRVFRAEEPGGTDPGYGLSPRTSCPGPGGGWRTSGGLQGAGKRLGCGGQGALLRLCVTDWAVVPDGRYRGLRKPE